MIITLKYTILNGRTKNVKSMTMSAYPPLLSLLKSASNKSISYSIDDDSILNDAIEIGLGPVLFYALQNNPEVKPQLSYPNLLSAELTSKILTSNYLEALHDIFDLCSEDLLKNIILLKGISIALQFYPKPHMRTMADLDILIEKKYEKELENICYELGYRQKSELPQEYYDALHHSMPFYHPEKNIWIEIHSALFPSHHTVSYEPVFSTKNILANTATITVEKHKVRRLSSELQLIYTCSHWVQEHNWMKSLMRVLDIIYIINNDGDELKWDVIKDWSGDNISTAQLYLILSLIKKYKLAEIPDEFLLLLFRKQKTLNKLNTYILHKLIIKYSFEHQAFGGLFSESLTSLIWRSLILSKNPPLINLFFLLPWNIVFPPKNKNRFTLSFQMSRLSNLFRSIF